MEREVGFLHARNASVVSMPQPNGSCYAFGRDVNMEWKHGVLPVRPEARKQLEDATGHDESGQAVGRISIIAWGWVDQTVAESRIRTTP